VVKVVLREKLEVVELVVAVAAQRLMLEEQGQLPLLRTGMYMQVMLEVLVRDGIVVLVVGLPL
tara:strand:- start:384 stop:572 length:189 start_codon:yes stop_codon:yes gene_type:complete